MSEIIADSATPLLKAAKQAAQDLSRPMQAIAKKLRADSLRNFDSGGWFPEHWKPSLRGGQTLVDQGHLRDSISIAFGSSFARIGTSLEYAAVHQFGAVIKPKKAAYLRFCINGRWSRKKQVTIPARPFMPIDKAGNLHPSTMTFAKRALARHISEGGKAE